MDIFKIIAVGALIISTGCTLGTFIILVMSRGRLIRIDANVDGKLSKMIGISEQLAAAQGHREGVESEQKRRETGRDV